MKLRPNNLMLKNEIEKKINLKKNPKRIPKLKS
jgi:hypothetical protein